jgi:hypothetical protein
MAAVLKEVDARAELLKGLGDLSDYEVGNNGVLAATYLRPEKTAGGIIMTARNLKEDLYQSKVHLVLKVGPLCEFFGFTVAPGDWIVIRPSDAWALDVNGVQCRHILDSNVRAKVKDPTKIW